MSRSGHTLRGCPLGARARAVATEALTMGRCRGLLLILRSLGVLPGGWVGWDPEEAVRRTMEGVGEVTALFSTGRVAGGVAGAVCSILMVRPIVLTPRNAVDDRDLKKSDTLQPPMIDHCLQQLPWQIGLVSA